MQSNFISYFDILGYKDAVLNSGDDFFNRVEHILRDIEFALSLDKGKNVNPGRIVADESYWITNAHFISDTIIFWPKSTEESDIENFLKVTVSFNNKMNQLNMPVRGCLHFGKFQALSWSHEAVGGGKWSAATIAGQALIEAHIKAENQSWAGTVIDKSVIEALSAYAELTEYIKQNSTLEMVPYKKSPIPQVEEYVLRLFPAIREQEKLDWCISWIRSAFASDNRNFDSSRAKEIFNNTIECLKRQIRQ